jgi:hypothetical protein
VPRDQAISLFVRRDVRIQQVKRDAADLDEPRLGAHAAAAHQDFDQHRLARFVRHLLNRQHGRMGFAVVLFLPAVAPQALAKIAVAINQADGDERQAEVARRFQMIAREHAQPAGIERQGVVDSVLGAEVGDRALARNLFVCPPVPRLSGAHVLVEARGQLAHAVHVHGVRRHLHQAKLRDLREQAARVVLTVFPDRGV